MSAEDKNEEIDGFVDAAAVWNTLAVLFGPEQAETRG
jgi:hypothetical protein